MKNNKQILNIKKKIIPVLRKYKIKKAGIFGSYARGDSKKKSDVDILVQPPKGMGLEFIGMGLELEEKLKKRVDLVTYKGMSPYLKKYILKDEIRIL
ncbi:nucleotidyltransferase family protein [Candidatus Woesearchaeota archaeon]|nr:nucleotidyltransferase family protein [Candidatus Woesearchaeota archaeon]